MPVFVFVVIAGLWAAFLLPSFLESRREAPIASTRNFARSTALLASVASASAQREAVARRRTLARRRQVLLGLILAAVTSLTLAILWSSVNLLILTLVCDALLAGYIAVLLQVKQQRASAPGNLLPLALESEPYEEQSSVRIVAG